MIPDVEPLYWACRVCGAVYKKQDQAQACELRDRPPTGEYCPACKWPHHFTEHTHGVSRP